MSSAGRPALEPSRRRALPRGTSWAPRQQGRYSPLENHRAGARVSATASSFAAKTPAPASMPPLRRLPAASAFRQSRHVACGSAEGSARLPVQRLENRERERETERERQRQTRDGTESRVQPEGNKCATHVCKLANVSMLFRAISAVNAAKCYQCHQCYV